MALPPLSANLQVKADHSCNWKCCFGCKDPKTPPGTPKSFSETETTEKVQQVVHRHWHSKKNENAKGNSSN